MDTSEIFDSQHPPITSDAANIGAFADRQKLLFDQLEVAELKSQSKLPAPDEPSPMDVELVSNSARKRKRIETKQFRGKESIFKRPEAPIQKCLLPKVRPAFQTNPNKWVKYSLEDVTPEDISNRSNTAAALSFLREIEERKQKDSDESENEASDKILFRKRLPNAQPAFQKSAILSTSITLEQIGEKPSFKSSKLVMPEYIVGQRKKREPKIKAQKTEKGKELRLDHLLEETDE